MKKAIVIYDTIYGNTEKVAKALASGMSEQGVQVDSISVQKVDINRLKEYDLLAIGGPTHAFGISKPMKGFLKKLKNVEEVKGKKAFAFDTRIKFRFAGSAAKKIEKELKKLRMNIVRSSSSAIVLGGEGPLEEGTEDKFRQIAGEIAKLI
ncbi:MAG: flavodoxin family protein [Candidatus Lokiarchaeia archaeon]